MGFEIYSIAQAARHFSWSPAIACAVTANYGKVFALPDKGYGFAVVDIRHHHV